MEEERSGERKSSGGRKVLVKESRTNNYREGEWEDGTPMEETRIEAGLGGIWRDCTDGKHMCADSRSHCTSWGCCFLTRDTRETLPHLSPCCEGDWCWVWGTRCVGVCVCVCVCVCLRWGRVDACVVMPRRRIYWAPQTDICEFYPPDAATLAEHYAAGNIQHHPLQHRAEFHAHPLISVWFLIMCLTCLLG